VREKTKKEMKERKELKEVISENLNLARAYFYAEQYQESIQVLELITELAPLHKTAFHLLGKNYMNLGDYPEAIENLEVSLSNYMNNKECYIDLGTCYKSLGMEDEANKIFKEIVEFFG